MVEMVMKKEVKETDEHKKLTCLLVKGVRVCDESTGSSLVTLTTSHSSPEMRLVLFFSASNWVMGNS